MSRPGFPLIQTPDLTDGQLVAAWNILQYSFRMLGDKSDLKVKEAEVKAELDKRGIPNQHGKRIVPKPFGYAPEGS